MSGAVLTLDVDWAPDWMVDALAGRLVAAGARATWFATHRSPALERLRAHPELFELGIHPNFLPGSSHGDDPAAVLAHVMALVPEAVSARAHGLVQSGALVGELVRRTPVRVDSSTFLPDAWTAGPVLQHTPHGPLTRVPFAWSDDHEPLRPQPSWDAARLLDTAGEPVLLFHPVRVCLNLADPADYERRKPRLARLGPDDAVPGDGPGPLFDAVVAGLAACGGGRRLRDLAGA